MKLADMLQTKTRPVPKVVILGDCGVGKTTYASKFPNPVFLDVESGTGSLDVPRIPIQSATDFNNAIYALQTEDHPFKTVIIDSVDWLETHLVKLVCTENRVRTLADLAYGRGYQLLADKWINVVNLLDSLRTRGLIIVLICHATPETVKHPDADEYQRMGLALQRSADRNKLIGWADIVIYISVKKDKSRAYNLESTAGFAAKCRYTGIKPECVSDPNLLLAAVGYTEEPKNENKQEKQ